MADQNKNQGAQNGAPTENPQGGDQLVEHIVTELDLTHNPELAKQGVKVGDKVKIPAEAKAAADKRESDAKAASNNSGDKTEKGDKAGKSKESGKFTVVSPFADKDDFSKKWSEGDDVSHFSKDRLADCVKRGLVKKG